jgi:hypothetical protein
MSGVKPDAFEGVKSIGSAGGGRAGDGVESPVESAQGLSGSLVGQVSK